MRSILLIISSSPFTGLKIASDAILQPISTSSQKGKYVSLLTHGKQVCVAGKESFFSVSDSIKVLVRYAFYKETIKRHIQF